VRASIQSDGVARVNLNRAQATALASRLIDALEDHQDAAAVPPAYDYREEIACIIAEGLGIGHVTVSPSPQSKDEENEKLHKLRRYARDFRRQHTTDAERFNWDSDDEDYGLAIGRLVVT
jgi:hypothetical protein